MVDPHNKLHDKLVLYPARIVACSGGIDSLVLATLAHRAAPEQTIVAHTVTPAVPGPGTARVVAFAERIRDGALVIPGPEDGRIVMAICDAAYHSSKLGQAVTL